MKLFLDFELCEECNSFIADLTSEDSLLLDDRAYISAIFALGLNSAAYQCATIRGAIAAIPSGQMEAGRSIGLNYMQTMGLVIMPQAIRICIPPLGSKPQSFRMGTRYGYKLG